MKDQEMLADDEFMAVVRYLVAEELGEVGDRFVINASVSGLAEPPKGVQNFGTAAEWLALDFYGKLMQSMQEHGTDGGDLPASRIRDAVAGFVGGLVKGGVIQAV